MARDDATIKLGDVNVRVNRHRSDRRKFLGEPSLGRGAGRRPVSRVRWIDRASDEDISRFDAAGVHLDWIVGRGTDFYELACQQDLEGIVAK
jgi:hypothetical protein